MAIDTVVLGVVIHLVVVTLVAGFPPLDHPCVGCVACEATGIFVIFDVHVKLHPRSLTPGVILRRMYIERQVIDI